ncbi:RNA polymerase sigma-70 factor [Lutibacter sp. A64]|uniref:RNA polymerase sigma factor n=1 Tax=Lutibacter sp. A64 TaxID=2918526 RepID=UPI001F054CE1|nr:RNA polymerase sigma-70 factor [Lutibacter sp. A64]UMB52496.1 RNA polymerase sigma-70 factor [Lutibacter sp. A64]
MILDIRKVILNLKKGDTNAFKLIFDAFYDRLYAFSYQYVKEKYAAEEIVENTMLMVWEKRKHLDAIQNLKSYLYKTVRNASLDYLKKSSKTVQLDTELHDTQFNQFIIEEETHQYFINAMELLPDKCRQIFKMCCIEGIKYKDVAEDLNISINTVKSQRARAVKLLQSHLKDKPFYLIILNLM